MCLFTRLKGQNGNKKSNGRKLRISGTFQGPKRIKICMMGSLYVGKTALVKRYVTNHFNEQYLTTVGGEYNLKDFTTKSGQKIKVEIWDTTGDEKYKSIMTMFYRDANAAILVYDVTRPETLADLESWVIELQQKVVTEGMVIRLLANKCDVPPEEQIVPDSAAKAFAQKHQLQFGRCSAKSGDGVNEFFSDIIEKWASSQPQSAGSTGGGRRKDAQAAY